MHVALRQFSLCNTNLGLEFVMQCLMFCEIRIA